MRIRAFGDRTRTWQCTRGTPLEIEISQRVSWEKCKTLRLISLTAWSHLMSTARSLHPNPLFLKITSTTTLLLSWIKRPNRRTPSIVTVSSFIKVSRRIQRTSEDRRWGCPVPSQFSTWTNHRKKRSRLFMRSLTTTLHSWLTTAICSETTRTKFSRWAWETKALETIQLFSNTMVATLREVTWTWTTHPICLIDQWLLAT